MTSVANVMSVTPTLLRIRERVIPFFILALCTQSASAVDQLLPEAAKSQITVAFKQDGRTVRGLITNQSSFVASSIEVSCFHSAPRPICPEKYGGKQSSLIVFPDDVESVKNRSKSKKGVFYDPVPHGCRYTSLGTEVRVKSGDALLPGKSTALYAEIPDGQIVDSCSISEVRGREKRWFNF